MKNGFRKRDKKDIFLIVTIILFSIGVSSFSNNDFWQDEIYTIEHFILVPWKTVFTDYHSTNNHIAFNALVKIFSKLFHVDNTFNAIERPYVLRVIPLLCTLFCGICLYTEAKKYYGKLFAQISISLLCTSVVYIDFAVQLRGYSLGTFLSLLQYFLVLRLAIGEKNKLLYLYLFFITTLSLLCLPTNIYLILAYLTLCVLLYLVPTTSIYLFNRQVSKSVLVAVGIVILSATATTLIYYRWLLHLQPDNYLILSFNLFNTQNTVQAFAVFYHFTDVRFYLYFILLGWLILYLKQLSYSIYSKLFFPAFIFFASFLFFYIHGAIIIQRTFVPLLPFYIFIIASAFETLHSWFRKRSLTYYFYLANTLSFILSISILFSSSKQNNLLSIHKHDLRNHYYLVNFNPGEIIGKVKEIQKQKNSNIYVYDAFGGTGIEYYFRAYKIHYQNFNDSIDLGKLPIIISNDKLGLEKFLAKKGLLFKKSFIDNRQYNLYKLIKK